MSKFTLVNYITYRTVTSFLDYWNLTTQTALYLINSPTTLSFLPNDGTAFFVFCTSTKCTYFSVRPVQSLSARLLTSNSRLSCQLSSRWMVNDVSVLFRDSAWCLVWGRGTLWDPRAVGSAASSHHTTVRRLDLGRICRFADWSLSSGAYHKFYSRYV